MKPSHPAESAQSSQIPYAPSVPMSVYRELAAEMRADKAVIDSLNSRNQLLQRQNQRLKQEIHSVVQATLTLGQFAGVARQSDPEGFPSAIAPDTLARLVRSEAQDAEAQAALPEDLGFSLDSLQLEATSPPTAPPSTTRQRVPRPISSQSQAASYSAIAPAPQPVQRQRSDHSAKKPAGRQSHRRTESVLGMGALAKTAPKLFTEKSGEYRSSALDSSDSKEIGSIWLVLSIILIIVTAFGAGFLIMKPLLNNR